MEFRTPASTDELDKKLHSSFPDARTVIIGVDYKNFAGMSKVSLTQDGNDGVERTAAELLMKGAEPMSVLMYCARCNRTWSAGGYKSNEGIFLLPQSTVCKQCGNAGEKTDTTETLAEKRP